MTEAEKNHCAYQRKLAKAAGASDQKSGVKVTANVAKAGAVRCPNTGRLFARGTAVFERMESKIAPR